jgi:hypothetical protein
MRQRQSLWNSKNYLSLNDGSYPGYFWFFILFTVVLALFTFVKEPPGKSPLGGPKSKWKNKIGSQENCDVGELKEITLKTCKFPQNLLLVCNLKIFANVLIR